MGMNNQGQIFMYSLMLGIVVIMMALILAGPTKDVIDSARSNVTDEGQAGLDCANSTITDFDKAGCLVSDITIFYFIGALIFVGGAVITARLVFG